MNRPTDELLLEARVAEVDTTYRFRTADGVHSKRSFRDAELLLLETLWDRDLGDCCCLEATYGVVGVVLGARSDSMVMTESSARAGTLCRRNAAENGVAADVALVAEVTELGARFDAVAYAPKPYAPIAVGARRIANGLSALRPGGDLFLAASRSTGLSRYASHLENLAGTVERVAGADGWHVLRVTRPDSFDPPAFAECRELTPSVDDTDLALVAFPGLFAASGLDCGTRLLLEAATVDDGERVLDCCCGYGAVGAYAGRVADCDLWCTDDDRVATRCAERSLEASGVEGTVVTADCLEGVADRTFDRVLCNPPTHAGSGVLSELFAGIADVLAPAGVCQFVRHRDLDLSRHLGPFDRVETIRTGAQHEVLEATS